MTKCDRVNLGWSWMILLISLCVPCWAQAADPVSKPPSPPATATAPVHDAEKATQPATPIAKSKIALTPKKKRDVVALTSFVIAGIVSILLLLFAWIFWMSRRTHRLLRAPLPAAGRGDELWYLKAKRPPSPTPDHPSADPPTPPA